MRYLVRALSQPGDVVSVAFEATDEADAQRQARSNGLTILSLRRAAIWNAQLLRTRSHFPLTLFTQELRGLLEAGLTLVDSIESLAEKEGYGTARVVLDHLCERLNQGRTLSQTMAERPHEFPQLFVATVRAGERSGDLPDALGRYAAYDAQLQLVRKKVVSASIYPALLVSVGLLVLLFLLGYVVPRFSAVYEDVRGDLPLMSTLLLNIGDFLNTNGFAAAIIALGTIVIATKLVLMPTSRRWLEAKLWNIPAIGNRMRLYQLARFYHTLGMLLRAGTPIVPAMDMVHGLLSAAMRRGLVAAREAIREGQSISEAMFANGLTTPVALRMLRVGERSGRMDEMMDRIAGFLDDDIARWVDWFTRLFEPLLMVFIGLVIGVIVVLMYMPIFELAGRIQ